MALFLDSRVKLRIGTLGEAGPTDALLVEGKVSLPAGTPYVRFVLPAATAHAIGCACCLPRGPVAEALSLLFLQRVRGEVAHFDEILAVPAGAAGEAAIRAALQNDPVVSARFRLVE
jgi:hypothetical protein